MTTIGPSTNLVVSGLLEQAGQAPEEAANEIILYLERAGYIR
jgi:hypothetical protein